MLFSRKTLKKMLAVLIGLVMVGGGWMYIEKSTISGAPPYGEPEETVPDTDPYQWIRDWKRPEGPAKIALQAGHWKAEEVPDELERLRSNTGSSGGGKWEWEVNLEIAEATAEMLRSEGVEVEILPATIPPRYWADVFVAIHADGNLNRSVAGFKVAAPWRDWSGKANKLAQNLDNEYQKVTKMVRDPNISRNMRGYYAFAWWRYEHALHPMTTAAIIETGFLTNAGDRRIIVARPEVAAEGIVNGIIKFLGTENLIDPAGEV